jgi:hypothetical protein
MLFLASFAVALASPIIFYALKNNAEQKKQMDQNAAQEQLGETPEPNETGGTSIDETDELVIQQMNLTEVERYLSNRSVYVVSIGCELEDAPETLPVLRRLSIPVSREQAEAIALDVFNFTKIDEIKNIPRGGLELSDDDRRLEFFGLHDVYYHELKARYTVRDWAEEEMIAIAEDCLSRLEEHWEPTVIERALGGVVPSHVSVLGGLTTVRELGVRYNLSVQGTSLHGPGADFVVCIADGRVIRVELHMPALKVEGYDEVTVSPMEALEKALSGESAQSQLGFQVICIRPATGTLNISDVDLIYYTDFHGNQTYLQPVYYIKGVFEGPMPGDEEIAQTEFHEFIFATDRRP